MPPDSLSSRRTVLVMAIAWTVALAWAALAGRALFADAAYGLLTLLQTPHQFFEYDLQRSFASFIIQAPVLLGERLGVESVSTYAALYSLGINFVPAASLPAAAFLSRAQLPLFAANMAAATVFGFGANYMPSEANLLAGFAVLCTTVILLEHPAPFIRGIVLPVIAFALLKVYEGMLLVGPLLAVLALFQAGRAPTERERLGLTIAGLLFVLAAVIAFSSWLAPRDAANAGNFRQSLFLFLGNPQGLLLAAAVLAFGAAMLPWRAIAIACAAASALCGVVFMVLILRMEGYYAYHVYHQNRAFMVVALPGFIVACALLEWLWGGGLVRPRSAPQHAALLIPFAFAIAADLVGTQRWTGYMDEFCNVLGKEASPAERVKSLKQSGALTAWAWTHPSMSVLLRAPDSQAMVANEPNVGWQPFDPDKALPIRYKGWCAAK